MCLDFLNNLTNLEYQCDRQNIRDLIADASDSDYTGIAYSGLWFDFLEGPDSDKFCDVLDDYDQAFHKIGEMISQEIGQPSYQGLGHNEETLQQIPMFEEHDLVANQIIYWKSHKLILAIHQEDKELPIDIFMRRL